MATAPHVSTVPHEGPCSRPSLTSRALPALRGSVLSCHRPCAGTWADGTATARDTSGDGDGGKNAKTPGSRSFRLEVTLSLLLAVPEPGESRGRAEAPRGLGAGARRHRGHHALPRGLSCAVHRGHSCAAPASLGFPPAVYSPGETPAAQPYAKGPRHPGGWAESAEGCHHGKCPSPGSFAVPTGRPLPPGTREPNLGNLLAPAGSTQREREPQHRRQTKAGALKCDRPGTAAWRSKPGPEDSAQTG